MLALFGAAIGPAGSMPAAAAQSPTAAPPRVIDGPSAAIPNPTGLALSIARDGSGALVHLKLLAGIPHVFVSSLAGGAFQPPVEVDRGLAGPSSQPVIAAGNGGVLLIAFINDGALYVVDRSSAATGFALPRALAAPASNPAIEMTNFGKAYIAFTVAHGGGSDVRSAYYYNRHWAVESAPLNAVPADDAGAGAGRPRVGAAGDGVAVVVWGEGGHIYSRRVWGTSPSIVDEQADAPLAGCSEVVADRPVVGVQGDSSYAEVAFEEQVSCGGGTQSRVLMRRLRGSRYEGMTQPDGLSGSTGDGAADPQIAMGEYGHGFITSARQTSHNVFATSLGDNGRPGGVLQVNGLSGGASGGMPAMAGFSASVVAWQQTPGAAGAPDIRLRYSPDSSSLLQEQVISSPVHGPANAVAGLAAGGDVRGEAAVAWVQGAGNASEIVAGQLYEPPRGFSLRQRSRYVRTRGPRLEWNAPSGTWGPFRYQVQIDGVTVAQTVGTSLTVPRVLAGGPHRWEVRAVDPAGLSGVAGPRPLFIDALAPTVAFTVTGTTRTGSRLRLRVSYRDRPPKPSGVAKVIVSWGDGSTVHLRPGQHLAFRAYARSGRYKVTVTVVDRAGNRARSTRHLTIGT